MGDWLGECAMRPGFYRLYGKRLFDLVVGSLVFLISLPVLLPCMLLLAWVNRGSIFFRQRRPGLNGQAFVIFKLKTMTDAVDAEGNLLPEEQRLTWIGKLIRKCSIDEVVQIINVIRGEMSLIGPRPLLMQYLELYSEYQMRRHEVLPGITGLAQVKGRNDLSWERRFRYDVFYVDHLSFAFDLRILYLTLVRVLRGSGVTPADGRPISEQFFLGSKSRD